ncbi:hypothetical protein T484DRAFT_1955794 [Baffinella frigidus]|nr:hypothetical protein T484DRAFT_1955794 [Cryptophyta sp. CCMP2293]
METASTAWSRPRRAERARPSAPGAAGRARSASLSTALYPCLRWAGLVHQQCRGGTWGTIREGQVRWPRPPTATTVLMKCCWMVARQTQHLHLTPTAQHLHHPASTQQHRLRAATAWWQGTARRRSRASAARGSSEAGHPRRQASQQRTLTVAALLLLAVLLPARRQGGLAKTAPVGAGCTCRKRVSTRGRSGERRTRPRGRTRLGGRGGLWRRGSASSWRR